MITDEDVLAKKTRRRNWDMVFSNFSDPKTNCHSGKGYDSTMATLATALTLLGINAKYICGGHMGDGHRGSMNMPKLILQAPGRPKYRLEGEEEIYKKVAKKFNITIDDIVNYDHEQAMYYADYLLSLKKRSKLPEYEAWREACVENSRKFCDLFFQWKRTRHGVSSIIGLNASAIAGGVMVIPACSSMNFIIDDFRKDPTIFEMHLKEARKEMDALGRWLEERYFYPAQ